MHVPSGTSAQENKRKKIRNNSRTQWRNTKDPEKDNRFLLNKQNLEVSPHLMWYVRRNEGELVGGQTCNRANPP